MLLFIFESIGTSELIMIGIVALIFLGPRKLPEIARKMGKIMADFRNTTNEFKQTWEREVNFEEEARAVRDIDADDKITPPILPSAGISAPEIKEVDASKFDGVDEVADNTTELASAEKSLAEESEETGSESSLAEKKNWL